MADVSTQSTAVAQMARHWPMLDALCGGTTAMRAAGKLFLPQWPMEDDASYQARLSTAVLFPAFKRTVEVMAAKPFSRALTIGKNTVHPEVEKLLGDVDLAGSSLAAFSAMLMVECLGKGLCGVLADYPEVADAKTRADEAAIGARPYLTQYPAASILGFRVAKTPSGLALSQLRLMETVTEEDGEFGDTVVSQVRVLTPGAWQVWRKVKSDVSADLEWRVYKEGATSLDIIPFVFFYGKYLGFGQGESPLLDLADLNIEHWQSSSDQQTILHAARVPVLFGKGFAPPDKIIIGAAAAVTTSNQDADLQYVEHTGAAIEAGRQSILDLEDRMRQIGAELLVQRPATATATQITSEGEGNKSTLQKIVERFEESVEACVDLMGLWLGLPTESEIELYKDFGVDTLPDQAGQALVTAAVKKMAGQTLFDQMKRLGILPPEADWAKNYTALQSELALEPAQHRQNQE